MIIEPIFLYVILIIIFLLACVLAVVILTQLLVFKKFADVKKSNEHLRAALISQEGEILASARQKANEIVEEAVKNAGRIEKNAEISRSQLSELLDKNLNEILQKYANELNASSEKALKDYGQTLKEQLEKNIERLNSMSKDVEKETIASMRKEVEQTKAEQLKRLREKIYDILTSASEEILGRSLSSSEHEELISQAVEKAVKREGL